MNGSPDSPSPIRFVMIVSGYPPRSKAGMERGCERLSRALVRRGHPVIVLTQHTPQCPDEEVDDSGVLVFRILRPLEFGPLWGITYMAQVRKFLLAHQTEWDFALCHGLYLHSAAMVDVCRKLRRPGASLLVNTGSASDIVTLRAHKFGERLLRKALQSTALFALSRRSAKELFAEGIPPERIWQYRYFVDTERFRPLEAGQEHDPHRFLYVGRFHAQKNVPLLIQAFTDLWRRHPQARLRLVGGGNREDEVRQQCRTSPATEAIEILDWIDEPAGEYRLALAGVTATNAEGLSNVLVEMLACGAPVITTDVSGARDALDPEGTLPATIDPGEFLTAQGGIITPLGDAPSIARAMEEVFTNREQRQRMAQQARGRAVSHYSEDSSVTDFLRAVRCILADDSADPRTRGFPADLFNEQSP